MSDEHMMLMSKSSIEAVCNDAFRDGRKAGVAEADEQWMVIRTVHRRLYEILEVKDGESLVDAVEQVYQELRTQRQAIKAAAGIIERQRQELAATKQYGDEVRAAYEPAQAQIASLAQEVLRLREQLEKERR